MYRFIMESENIEQFRDAENIQEWTKGQTLQLAPGVFLMGNHAGCQWH